MFKHDADLRFMERAFANAEKAYKNNEVPIGAVVVYKGKIISEAFNSVIDYSDPTAHAEILALREAGKKIGNYRLTGAEIFVTLEPCLMCYSAMVHSRVRRLVYAASDMKTGYFSTGSYELIGDVYNHRIEREYGLMRTESSELLKKFFKERRDAGAAERGGLENR